MGLGPLVQPLFYQYKCTLGGEEALQGNGSMQSGAPCSSPGLLRIKTFRSRPNRTMAAQPCKETGASPLPPTGNQLPGHRSRGRATRPATRSLAPERRAAAAGRCTPRQSRGTLKDGRRQPELCVVCSALRHGRRQARFRGTDRSERLGAFAEDRQVGVVGKQAIAPASGDLSGDAQLHQGLECLAGGGEAQSTQLA